MASLFNRPAPQLKLWAHTGEIYDLKPGSKGKPTVIFFYPKSGDESVGAYACTKEACSFRDHIASNSLFSPDKLEIVGISGDTVDTQRTFAKQHSLPYPILSDTTGEARRAYKVGQLRSRVMGLMVGRVTYVVDSRGIVIDGLDTTSTALSHSQHCRFVSQVLQNLE
ncbi:alkyl hydroperoxide reductase/ thiol specific antioxidant/ Mal allergen, partial [Fistulina hepatica ATCC 64428]